MRAAYIEEIGGPDKLIVGDLPTPGVGSGQMLVRTNAAGVGPWDWKMMGGTFGTPSLPFIPGLEVAGVIEQAGPDLGFQAGDEVIASTGFTAGGFAQYVAVDPGAAALKPGGLSFEEAVALVVGGATAYEGLADRINLQPGETVLITAASGGVGTMAVQIAAALGARVLGVASARNLDYVRRLGASDAFDYAEPGWSEEVLAVVPGGVDALFDAAGGATAQEALRGVRAGGRGAFIGYPPPEIDPATGITADFFSASVNRQRLEAITALVAGGQLRVELAQVFPLEEARAALEAVQGGHTRGKVALSID
ncbi:MAG TPA: NADP-dependent oxidoreductase [Actinomycetota bacterium]|nr:NADP-dependent oxidoreductase [Actinomycetota bacterium]